MGRVNTLKRRTVPRNTEATLSTVRDPHLNDLRIWLEGGFVHISAELSEEVKDVRVLFSGSPGGPFDELYADLDIDYQDFRYRDDTRAQTSNTRYTYYLVEIRLKEDGKVLTYGWDRRWDRATPVAEDERYGITWGPQGHSTVDSPAIIRELRQRFQMIIDRVQGVKTLMYRPAWTRKACPACTDPRTGSTTTSMGLECSECYGTGFEGGFYSPMLTERVPQTDTLQRAYNGVFHTDHQEQTQNLVPYWPRLEPGDILRDVANSKLWEVLGVYDGDLHQHAVMSQVVLTELPITHPLNSLPMPEKIRQMSSAPRRQYARATNLESYEDAKYHGVMAQASAQSPDYSDTTRSRDE